MYKSILKEEPNYTDAYLRLSYLAKNRGDIKRSLDFVEASKTNFKKGFNQPTNLFCIKGSFLKSYGQLKESIDEYQQAYQLSGNRDSYALVAMANIEY